jgi:hypothetical protein
LFVAIALAAFLAPGLLQAQATESPLAGLLPDPSGLDGWTIKDEAQAYEGDDLYIYIDGGAEIYQEYGFKRVLAQDYWKGERSISLEIFEMASPESAYGIFAFKRSKDGTTEGIGSADSMESYYMNFWKGRFLVTLTGMNQDEETMAGIKILARGVDKKIQDSADMPKLLGALPAEGLVPSSRKYLKGKLGLFNIYAFFTEDVFGLKEAVKADYIDGTEAFVFRYDSSDEAAGRFATLEKAFRESPKYRNFVEDQAIFRFEDENSRRFRVGLQGSYILMISGASSDAGESEAFDRLIRSVTGSGL